MAVQVQLRLSTVRLLGRSRSGRNGSQLLVVLHHQVFRISRHVLLRPSQETGPNHGTALDPSQRNAFLLLVGCQVLARRSRDLLLIVQHVRPCCHVQLLLAGRFGTEISEISMVEKASYFAAADAVYYRLDSQFVGFSQRM